LHAAKWRNDIVDARDEEHGVEVHSPPQVPPRLRTRRASRFVLNQRKFRPQRLKARRPHHRNSNSHLHARHECCPHPWPQPRASTPLRAKNSSNTVKAVPHCITRPTRACCTRARPC
ncbi:hypothetical protein B0H14DRAFT_3852975, partial [Mycena olivaceomarginata]